jgi:hypothetical protein
MSKRKASKYEGLVPDHFKQLVRSALQKPKVAEQPNKPCSLSAEIEVSSLQRNSRAACASSFSPDVAPCKPLSLPQISSSSFYRTKEQAVSPPRACAARAIASSPQQASSGYQIAPAEPAYMRLIQLYKKRCSLFGAERRQLCFQMFAKLKEALEYASQKTHCHVFAQEGVLRAFAFSPLQTCFRIFVWLTSVNGNGCRLFFVCKVAKHDNVPHFAVFHERSFAAGRICIASQRN